MTVQVELFSVTTMPWLQFLLLASYLHVHLGCNEEESNSQEEDDSYEDNDWYENLITRPPSGSMKQEDDNSSETDETCSSVDHPNKVNPVPGRRTGIETGIGIGSYVAADAVGGGIAYLAGIAAERAKTNVVNHMREADAQKAAEVEMKDLLQMRKRAKIRGQRGPGNSQYQIPVGAGRPNAIGRGRISGQMSSNPSLGLGQPAPADPNTRSVFGKAAGGLTSIIPVPGLGTGIQSVLSPITGMFGFNSQTSSNNIPAPDRNRKPQYPGPNRRPPNMYQTDGYVQPNRIPQPVLPPGYIQQGYDQHVDGKFKLKIKEKPADQGALWIKDDSKATTNEQQEEKKKFTSEIHAVRPDDDEEEDDEDDDDDDDEMKMWMKFTNKTKAGHKVYNIYNVYNGPTLINSDYVNSNVESNNTTVTKLLANINNGGENVEQTVDDNDSSGSPEESEEEREE